MKKSILNLGAIAIAFCLGISIHNSCADPDNYSTTRGDASTEELWAAIDALKEEVNALKSKVQTLENGTGTETASDCGSFLVDGLWYNRGGGCESQLKSITTSISNGSSTTMDYHYDSQGRLSSYGNTTITYNGKVHTYTSKTENPDGSITTVTNIYEYK